MRGYGAASISDGYGITEIFPLGGNCPFSTQLHLSEDMVIVECLNLGQPDRQPPARPANWFTRTSSAIPNPCCDIAVATSAYCPNAADAPAATRIAAFRASWAGSTI